MRLRLSSLHDDDDDASDSPSVCVLVDGRWVVLLDDAPRSIVAFLGLDPDVQKKHIEAAWLVLASPAEAVLPFAPLTFRDAALYKGHVANCSKGFARIGLAEGHWLQLLLAQLLGKPARLPTFSEKPAYYMGNVTTFLKDGAVVDWPPHSSRLDYELEYALVISRHLPSGCTLKEAETALRHCGVVLINDFSARDCQLDELVSVGFGFVKSKCFATSMASVVLTFEEFLDVDCSVSVNGEKWSSGNTSAEKCCSLAEYLQYAALGEGLQPGELLGCGTIPGCSGLEVNKWLRPGDLIRLECGPLGSLENRIGDPPKSYQDFKTLCFSKEKPSRLLHAAKLLVQAVVVPPILCLCFFFAAIVALLWTGPNTKPPAPRSAAATAKKAD